jgi:hypothetical protein
MARSLVVTSQERPRALRYHRDFILGTGEPSYRVKRIEPHHGYELDLCVPSTPEEFNAVITLEVSLRDGFENLLAEECLVGIGICRRGPSVPDATNHLPSAVRLIRFNITRRIRPLAPPMMNQ